MIFPTDTLWRVSDRVGDPAAATLTPLSGDQLDPVAIAVAGARVARPFLTGRRL